MNNDITALRSTLFDTLRALKEGTLDIDRAKAINDTAQVIINTAKAEVDYMRVSGSNAGTDFIPVAPRKPSLPPPSETPTATGTKTVNGNVTTHRLK